MAVDLAMPVLVVDDYKTMVRIIQNLLKSIGFTNVHGALSGDEAITKMAETDYGLIISDWNMEPMSGYDLLVKLRGEDATKELPFIMVTAESKSEKVVAAKRAGVNNYIVKPFNAQTLKQKIAVAFGDAG
jgi:two-component system chemotaxis response regulator CheY